MEETLEMLGRMQVAVEMIEGCEAFASLIPEVRTNFIYARKDPQDRMDVLAVEGRITVVRGRPHASGPIRFGASSHMARFLVHIHEKYPSIRSGINFANNPRLTAFLGEYCRMKGWTLVPLDRSHEPDEIKEEEGASSLGRRAKCSVYPQGSLRK